MNPRPWGQRAFLHGVATGLALPLLILVVLAFAGELRGYLQQSRGYALLPWLAPLGFATFFLGARLHDHYHVPRYATAFAMGTLTGGSIAGALLLWFSAPERPFLNRIVFAAFGGPLLLGFWLWIGSILGYAWRQNRAKAPSDAS